MRRRAALVPVLALGLLAVAPEAPAQGPAVPTCAIGGPPVTFTGTITSSDARTYRDLELDVPPGTTRVEVTYDWAESGPTPDQLETVLDLGLWDADGNGRPDGFRGWSGSRGGRVATGQDPVFVQPDVAARGYRPGPIEPGVWTVDLGLAHIGPSGATWQVDVTCSAPAVGSAFQPDPVDPAHVADPAPGWYHGDLHMHGYHSNADAPEWHEIVDTARDRGLDFLPLTDYVTGQHWDELGAVQDANPDVVIWPGREIITYFGHANALGETRSILDYRHGHRGLTLAEIQSATVADGALFQVNHPSFFPPPLAPFCRGCFFELGGVVDWSRVDTIEVLTGPVLVTTADVGLPPTPTSIQNPFVQPAIDRWHDLLRQGFDITAVSGSDSKGVESEPERRGYGSSATAVFATELSRPALMDALREGHAYVRTRGVEGSPEVELTGTADGADAIVGDTLVTDRAQLSVTVRGASGQRLTILRDGEPVGVPVPITSDPFTHAWTADRDVDSGPLGTFWRVDVADERSLTAITNPIFLRGDGTTAPPTNSGEAPSPADDELPATGQKVAWPLVGAVLVAGALLLGLGRSSRPTPPTHGDRSPPP